MGLEQSCKAFEVDLELIEKIAFAEDKQEHVKIVNNNENISLHIQQLNVQISQEQMLKNFSLQNANQKKGRQLTPSKERLMPITQAMKKNQNNKCWQEVLQDQEIQKTKFDLIYKTKTLKSRGNHLIEIFRRSNRPKVSRQSFRNQKLRNSYNFMNQEQREFVTKNKISLNYSLNQDQNEQVKGLSINDNDFLSTPAQLSQRAYTLTNQINSTPIKYQQMKSNYVDQKKKNIFKQREKSQQYMQGSQGLFNEKENEEINLNEI